MTEEEIEAIVAERVKQEYEWLIFERDEAVACYRKMKDVLGDEMVKRIKWRRLATKLGKERRAVKKLKVCGYDLRREQSNE